MLRFGSCVRSIVPLWHEDIAGESATATVRTKTPMTDTDNLHGGGYRSRYRLSRWGRSTCAKFSCGMHARLRIISRAVWTCTLQERCANKDLLTTRKAAWYIISVLSVCLSHDNFRQSWRIAGSFRSSGISRRNTGQIRRSSGQRWRLSWPDPTWPVTCLLDRRSPGKSINFWQARTAAGFKTH